MLNHLFYSCSFLLAVLSAPAQAMPITSADSAMSQGQSAYITQVAVSDSTLSSAQSFIDDMAGKGISFLKDESLSDSQRKAKFKSLLESRFDLERIGRFTLGRYWRDASSAQQSEYQKLFRTMIVDVYSRRFQEYQGQTITVGKARPEGSKDVVVNSTIKGAGTPSVPVQWRVRPSGKSFKVIDVIVAGVSMAVTQRSDFASVIQRGGGKVDALLEHLRNQ